MKGYRENITRQQAEARRQALVQLLRSAGHAVDANGSRESLDCLDAALNEMSVAYEPLAGK